MTTTTQWSTAGGTSRTDFDTVLRAEFGVTNKRVLAKVGTVSCRSMEILLTKVEGMSVNQGILGRILGYGAIVVNGTGGTKERFGMVAEPFDFRKRVQEQVAAVQEAK
ncbi:MAG TPA: PH domain-containing protein [Terriglobales bacterium]|nr:PH domain-containing protein [Terriglobales bacterium]